MDLSPEEILRRKNTLIDFDNYFENVTKTLMNFTEKIGWNVDETPTDDMLIKCPVNNAHKVLPSNLDSHRQSCELEQNGYNSTDSIYPSHNSLTPLDQTIQIDKTTQMNILKSAQVESNYTLNVKHKARDVSQSIERYVCDFTPDERRVLYDYAVQNTKLSNQDAIKDLTDVDVLNKSNEKPKTELELLQEQRDSKRRRVAYRGKRVHTDRKSHTEVLREVVEGLTNSLQSQQEQSTSICTETSSSGSQTVLNNRIVYKYEGIQNYGSNPYTRWLDIESEESKLIDSSEMKNYRPSYKTHYKESRSSSSRLQMSKRPKSRPRSYSSSNYSSKSSSKSRSRSRSRSRTRYKERNYKSKRYRSPTKYEKNKYKSSKTESISQETMPKESKIQPMSVESHFKKSKRHRSRTRSKSQDLNSYKKVKSSKSPINYFKLSIPNEEETTVKLKSSHAHKKKKKKKKSKRKHI